MARSPATATAGSAASDMSAAKAKAHAVLTKARMQDTDKNSDRSKPVPDLAEQLNDETRRKYVKGKQVGEGTYANVYLGHLAADPKQLVAIKKIKVNKDYKDGLALDAVREVKFLQELSHPNIIALYCVYSSKDQNLNLVLEYLPLGDLEELIKDIDNIHYSLADMKAWMGMMCRGVWFCHENFVLHRDIKPNNMLIAADGEIKLADFGLARSFADPQQVMSHQVITRWYRPPELFYKARHYSGAVDVWSVGTVFAELIKRFPYLVGETDIGQLTKICEWVGTPTEENWPGVSKLRDYIAPDVVHPIKDRTYYQKEFGVVGDDGVDLLMAMLKLDPRKRITSREVLQHKWWFAQPRPTAKESLPRKGGGPKKMGEDLKRRGGELDNGRGDKIARKLDFGSVK